MAVLVECISVIVKVSAIRERYPGGWVAFVEAVPNRTLCSDGKLARVGFMSPPDVEAFVRGLERAGLRFLDGGAAADLVVADQRTGFTTPCDWAVFGEVGLEGGHRVAACRAVGCTDPELATPEGWTWETSMTSDFRFVPTEEVEERLEFLGREDGQQVYRDRQTGEKVYMATTAGGEE